MLPKGIAKEQITFYANKHNLQLVKYYSEINLVYLKGKQKDLIALAQTQLWVQYMDIPSIPTLLNNGGKNNSRSTYLDFGVRNLTGKGINIGVWDGSPGGEHIDFATRYTYGESPSIFATGHGTHTTGTMAGAGNRHPQARGMAPEANIFGYTLNTGDYIQYEMFQAIQKYNITLTQNSYGQSVIACPLGWVYSIDDRSRDQLVNMYPELLHVFAIGNSQTPCFNDHGNAFGSTAGNCGKNTITVGAVTETDAMTNFSSFGPSRDGRIKPDVVAVGGYNIYSTQANNIYGSFGWSGTSMACPVVSGVAAQLQQRYKQLFGVANPPASLIKAVICNGAKDLGNPNPDYKFGFGRVNAINSVLALEQNRFVVDKVSQGNTKMYNITVPANVTEVKILLAWSDIAALPTSGLALVNNLNLQVSDGITTYNPWVLDPANRDNVAVRGIDNLNNIEQITIQTPIAGNYTITVTGAAIPLGEQEFALTWEAETPYIRVAFPAGNEKLLPNTNYTAHWDSNINTGTFDLDYSVDNGTTWTNIATGLSPTVLQNTLATGIVFTDKALIRVTNGVVSATSEQNFTVMAETTNVAINPINNGGEVTWNVVAGATGYDVMLFDPATNVWTTAQSNVLINNATITNLVNGKTYWASVKARAGTVIGERAYANPFVPAGAGATADLALQNLIAPITNPCIAKTNAEDVTVEIRNSGSTTIPNGTNIPLSYQIDTQPAVNELFTLTADLLVGTSINYTFIQKANLVAETSYNFVVKVNLATDVVTDNNEKSAIIGNFPLPLPTISGTLNLCAGSTTLTTITPTNTYAISNIPFATQNMASATVLTLADEAVSDALTIGFPFKFFEQTYNEIFVSSNGLVGFTKFGLEYYTNLVEVVPQPAYLPNNFIAFAWGDLNPAAGGTITYQQMGVAPNRKFIVDFNNIPFQANSANKVTAQVILHENNTIEIQVTDISAGGIIKTMGLENIDASLGVAVTGRNASIWSATNEGILFTPHTTGILWLPSNETTKEITVTQGGDYTVSYTQNGCTLSKTVTVLGKNIYVRKDGNDINNGLSNNAAGAKLTLQAAINAVTDCDIITLHTGTYNEIATINNKNITLINVGNPILQSLVVNSTGKTLNLVGNLAISNIVNLQAGNLNSNGNLTLSANTTTQAMLLQSNTTNIIGDVNVQRYLRANNGLGGTATLGYRFVSSPTNNATLQQLSELSPIINPAFNSALLPGRIVPFPTLYSYDATKAGDISKVFLTSPTPEFDKGWVSPNALTEPMTVAKGFTINTNANQVLEITGTLNNGNINIPITTGNAASLGYNLVGNPYPSPILWSSVRALSSGVNDAIYQNIATGQYTGAWASYVNGVGVNGATDTVAVMQGFFVTANSIGSVNFANATRVNSYANPSSFRTEDDENSKKITNKIIHNGLLRFALTNAANKTDETVIYFTEKATPNFDNQFDALKLQLNGGSFSNIYTHQEIAKNQDTNPPNQANKSNKNMLFAINALPKLTDDLVIPIIIQSWNGGSHKISMTEQANFNRQVDVYLRDKATNNLHDFAKGSFDFSVTSGVIADRFELIFKPQLTTAELNGDNLNVFPNPSSAIIHISIADLYKGALTLRLTDMLGREIWTEKAEKTSKIYENTLTISNLASGTYLLEVLGDKKTTKKIIKQ